MRSPDCILVRFGEISLKSKQVQRVWMNRFLSNIKQGLDAKKVKYKLAVNPNRLFIYTTDIKKTSNLLEMIFGITSFSYVWTCVPDIPDMKKLGVELTENVKLNKKKSFAIRARRSGTHAFTSQDIGREVGDAVNIKTGAGVDLGKPDVEIFVECRQDKAYLFLDRIDGPGGMPLGTAGKAMAIMSDDTSVAAAWLIMKRGCWLGTIGDKKSKNMVKILEKWHIGKKLDAYYDEDPVEVSWKNRFRVIVASEKVKKTLLGKFYDQKMLVLRPLVGFEPKEIKRFLDRINSK
jgi:thiamine biosynthesis protein ThiI